MNWRFLALLAFFVLLNLWLGDGEEPRRPVPEAVPGDPDYGDLLKPLPDSSAFDSEISVGLGAKTDSTGTAFAWYESGWWMTARHVVDRCRQIQLRFPGVRPLTVRRRVAHSGADLALLYTAGTAPTLTLSGHPLYVGQNGYQIGYPHGTPGEVWSTLLGRRRMRVSGRYRTVEPILAWAERRRRPSNLRSLGGLSGGPTLDGGGQVIGVLVAESTRRGRVYTAAPRSLRQLLPKGASRESTAGVAISPSSLNGQAERLRQVSTVAKVICAV